MDGGNKSHNAGAPLDIVTPTSSSPLCTAKTVMSTVIDSVPTRPRAVSFGRVRPSSHRSDESNRSTPERHAATHPPRWLSDLSLNQSGTARPFSGFPFRSVPFWTSARGRGQRATSVSRASLLPDCIHTRRGYPATELSRRREYCSSLVFQSWVLLYQLHQSPAHLLCSLDFGPTVHWGLNGSRGATRGIRTSKLGSCPSLQYHHRQRW